MGVAAGDDPAGRVRQLYGRYLMGEARGGGDDEVAFHSKSEQLLRDIKARRRLGEACAVAPPARDWEEEDRGRADGHREEHQAHRARFEKSVLNDVSKDVYDLRREMRDMERRVLQALDNNRMAIREEMEKQSQAVVADVRHLVRGLVDRERAAAADAAARPPASYDVGHEVESLKMKLLQQEVLSMQQQLQEARAGGPWRGGAPPYPHFAERPVAAYQDTYQEPARWTPAPTAAFATATREARDYAQARGGAREEPRRAATPRAEDVWGQTETRGRDGRETDRLSSIHASHDTSVSVSHDEHKRHDEPQQVDDAPRSAAAAAAPPSGSEATATAQLLCDDAELVALAVGAKEAPPAADRTSQNDSSNASRRSRSPRGKASAPPSEAKATRSRLDSPLEEEQSRRSHGSARSAAFSMSLSAEDFAAPARQEKKRVPSQASGRSGGSKSPNDTICSAGVLVRRTSRSRTPSPPQPPAQDVSLPAEAPKPADDTTLEKPPSSDPFGQSPPRSAPPAGAAEDTTSSEEGPMVAMVPVRREAAESPSDVLGGGVFGGGGMMGMNFGRAPPKRAMNMKKLMKKLGDSTDEDDGPAAPAAGGGEGDDDDEFDF